MRTKSIGYYVFNTVVFPVRLTGVVAGTALETVGAIATGTGVGAIAGIPVAAIGYGINKLSTLGTDFTMPQDKIAETLIGLVD